MVIKVTGRLNGILRSTDNQVMVNTGNGYSSAADLGIDPLSVSIPTRYEPGGKQQVLTERGYISISATVGDAVLGSVATLISPAGGITLAIPGSTSAVLPKPTGRKGKTLFDFADTGNWAAIFGPETITSSTTKQYSANGLAVTPQSASDGVKKSFGASTFAIQSGTLLALLVYIPAAAITGTNSIIIKLSSDNNTSKSLSYTITNSYLKNPGWQVIYFRAGEDGTQEYGGGATWTAANGEAWGNNFNYFHILLGGFSGQTVVLDSVLVGARDVPRVVFTFDNIAPSLMSVIAPSLAAYGWAAGLMMDGDTSTVNTNLSNAKTLINSYGWDVGTQGITHTDYQSNGRDITADFNTASANFVAAGLPAPTTFAYPLNSSGKATDTALAALGVSWRRGTGVDIQPNLGFGIPGADDGMVRSGFTQHIAQNFNLGTNYQQIVNRLNRLLLQGGTLSLFTHKETALSTDWSLGGDLTQWYMLIDLLYEYQYRYGLQVIKPSQVKPLLNAAIFN